MRLRGVFYQLFLHLCQFFEPIPTGSNRNEQFLPRFSVAPYYGAVLYIILLVVQMLVFGKFLKNGASFTIFYMVLHGGHLPTKAFEVGMVQLPVYRSSHSLAWTSVLVATCRNFDIQPCLQCNLIIKIAVPDVWRFWAQGVFLLFSYKFEVANQPFDA